MVKNTTDNFDIKKALFIYLKQWRWFVLSLIICIVLAYINLRYTTPEYNAYAKIMIVGDEGMSSPAEAILQDLGKISSVDKEIQDEIEILKSRSLMKGVVKELSLNIQYFFKGRVHDKEIFPYSPIKVNFIESDSIIDKYSYNFAIEILSKTEFNFISKIEESEEEISKKHLFGSNITTPLGELFITPTTNNISSLIGQVIYTAIVPVDKVAEYYKDKIKITQVDEYSEVIILSLNDPVKIKAQMIINTLVDNYNSTSINEKNLRSKNTADFINNRINLISKELAEVDDEIQNFKTGNKLTDITSEASLYLSTSADTERNMATSRTELNIVNSMRDLIIDESSFSRIPSNIGLADNSINSMALKYNDLLDNRNALLKSSNAKNPIIVSINEQLSSLRKNLTQSLNNSSQTIGLKLRGFENQYSKLNSKIFAVPGQVRKSRDIEREQDIKETLYLYLLQKREEATISLISTSPNAKIIDTAHSLGYGPVSPNKTLTYFAAFIFGLCIPIGIIYISELLDTKIHNKEDLESVIKNITVIGEIPKVKMKEANSLVKRNDRSILSESFRTIRTNFDYVQRGRDVDNYSNVIFVTSTINGEGKSFFSMNMALTLANTDKRVLLIGADIRNPQIFPGIKNKQKSDTSKTGLTEYLVDKSVLIGEAINTFDINDNQIDVLLSGKVPPNPAELLMNERMKTLFDKVSGQYDYVIVDTAPAMLVTDTLLFSQYSGHTIYLTRAGYTEKRILNFAKELHADKKLNGMMLVVNDVKQSNFGYGAKYGYYGAKEKKSFFKLKRA